MKYILNALRGMAMGAADIVPGVSGGTIAFITGIYEELIDSIKSLDFEAIKILFQEGPKSFWMVINGNFLLSLFIGIILSILGLSKLISYLLDHHPVLLWSFFFGLILASVVFISRQISEWKVRVWLAIILGGALSYWVTIATPTQSPDGFVFLFFYGFLAIIAMILPGISGAFILLLLGAYGPIIALVNSFRIALTDLDIAEMIVRFIPILIFILGCLAGLITFSRVLSWMFKHYKNSTLALLTGFMIGSLNKIWPWKTTISSRIAHEGKENEAIVPFIQENVWPWNFNELNEIEQQLSIVPDKDPQLIASIILMIIGLAVIFILGKFSPENES